MRVRLRSERRIVGRDLKEERIVDAAVHRKDGDKIAFAEREELLSRQKNVTMASAVLTRSGTDGKSTIFASSSRATAMSSSKNQGTSPVRGR